MADTTTLCVSVQAGEHLLSGPDWLKVQDTKTLVDVLVEVSGTQALGYQVQVIVSKEPSFTEAALMKILNCVSMLHSSGNIYVKFLLKSSVLPSQQRYEDTKCRAERDTDVPLIESLQNPMKQSQDDVRQPNAMSIDQPFESNYLNKLLSEQNLSPTTLSSLKKELIKKRHFKEYDHYTTWQEQIITSPVKESQSIPIASVQPQYQGLTNWADGNKVEDSKEYEGKLDESYEDDGKRAACNPELEKEQPHVQEQKKNATNCNEMTQRAEHQTAKKAIENSSVTDSISMVSPKTSSKVKDEIKKVPVRKTIIPKTNRSTALRVKKNLVSCGGIQKKNKSESQKSGMPILSQKTTRSTQIKPNKILKSNCGSTAMEENEAKESSSSFKRNVSTKASIDKKDNIQSSTTRSRRCNNASSCLKPRKRESPNQLKQEEAERKIQSTKASQSLVHGHEVENDTNSESMKSRTEINIPAVDEKLGKYNVVNQENKKKELRRVKDTASVNKDEVLYELCTTTDKKLKGIHCDKKKHNIEKDTNSTKSCSDSVNTKCKIAEFPEITVMKECSLVISEPEVTSTPNAPVTVSTNKPVFTFNGFDDNFLRENSAVDSFDDITIYESKNDKNDTSSPKGVEESCKDTSIVIPRGTRENSFSELEMKVMDIEHNRRHQTIEAEFLDCDTVSSEIDEVENILGPEGKDSFKVTQNVGHEKSGEYHLTERPKFFKSFPNQASFGKLLQSSFDSSDFIDSSEIQRKSAMDSSKSLKRSVSLDRDSSGIVPKKTGFFHDLKEKAKDADNGLLFSINDHNDSKIHASLSIVDEVSEKLSLPIALPENIINMTPSNTENVDYDKKSPSQTRQRYLNITMDKIDLGNLSTSECNIEQTLNGKSPTLIGEIGRESAFSRTFSLENDNDNEVPQPKSESQGAALPRKEDKLETQTFNKQSKNLDEEMINSEKNQHSKDNASTDFNIHFGEDMTCHTRRKWNLEIDIIDQLLISSLEDQCKSLSTTAERILSKLRTCEHEKETSHKYFEENEWTSSDALNSQVGITGKIFKTLQSLEKQLAEIEKNLGKNIDHGNDITNRTKNDK